MVAARQLRLVQDAPPTHGASQDPVRQVFEHWVYMLGYMPARTKLDAERRQVINGALQLYDVPTLMLAIDGMAAVPLEGKPESMADSMREISWFMARAKRVESALRWADKLAEQLAQQAARAAAVGADPAAPTEADAAAAQAGRDKLRAMAQQMRARVCGHG